MIFFNLCVLGQVDSGKTSLCKSILRYLNVDDTLLDNLFIEKRRGITVKLKHTKINNKDSIINLLDTPGHSELVAEVIRACSVSQNIILIIDVNKGIENHVINLTKYLKNKNVILIFNKMDFVYNSQITNTINYLVEYKIKFFFICVSARLNQNISCLMDSINLFLIEEPEYPDDVYLVDVKYTDFGYECIAFVNHSLKIKDDLYDSHSDIVKVFKILDGALSVEKVNRGIFSILVKKNKQSTHSMLEAGPINFTIKTNSNLAEQPPISSGLFAENFNLLSKAIQFIQSTYPSTRFQRINHDIFGAGYQIYATGSMEIEIIVQRMEKEFQLNIIATPPFSILKYENEIIINPHDINPNLSYQEQFIRGEIDFDDENKDKIINFLRHFDFEIEGQTIKFYAPLSLLDTQFYNALQNINKGKSELHVVSIGWKDSTIAIVDIYINGVPSGLRFIFHENDYINRSKEVVNQIANFILLKNFTVKVQAIYRNKSFYTASLSARKNDVAGKCYGGDYSRKMKLWNKQKQGRKKQSKNFRLKGKELHNIANAIYKKK